MGFSACPLARVDGRRGFLARLGFPYRARERVRFDAPFPRGPQGVDPRLEPLLRVGEGTRRNVAQAQVEHEKKQGGHQQPLPQGAAAGRFTGLGKDGGQVIHTVQQAPAGPVGQRLQEIPVRAERAILFGIRQRGRGHQGCGQTTFPVVNGRDPRADGLRRESGFMAGPTWGMEARAVRYALRRSGQEVQVLTRLVEGVDPNTSGALPHLERCRDAVGRRRVVQRTVWAQS